MSDKLVLAGREFDSRLIIGTGKYVSAIGAVLKSRYDTNALYQGKAYAGVAGDALYLHPAVFLFGKPFKAGYGDSEQLNDY